ncbi:MAG: argininosuccinate synthase, partial [Candidatus Omnitrophota bacterium]|nr:argininosuccinate synthase [Candidatus Omnitrophota bacterium]
MKKVVLAYSGGLDTSCIVRWLRERGYEVICFVADLGQGLGQGESFEAIEERALAAGASKVYIRDLQEEFIDDFIIPA